MAGGGPGGEVSLASLTKFERQQMLQHRLSWIFWGFSHQSQTGLELPGGGQGVASCATRPGPFSSRSDMEDTTAELHQPSFDSDILSYAPSLCVRGWIVPPI
jgi:hypothetical protein